MRSVIVIAMFCAAIGISVALAQAGGRPHIAKPAPRPQAGAPLPRIRLPLNMAITPHPRMQDDAPQLRLGGPDGTRERDLLAGSAVSIGPLKARLGGTSRKAHIARYKLEGMDILGGSVSGTLDGRGARVYLRWPPSDDD